MRRPSVSPGETLPQAEFTSAEDVKSARRAPKRARAFGKAGRIQFGQEFPVRARRADDIRPYEGCGLPPVGRGLAPAGISGRRPAGRGRPDVPPCPPTGKHSSPLRETFPFSHVGAAPCGRPRGPAVHAPFPQIVCPIVTQLSFFFPGLWYPVLKFQDSPAVEKGVYHPWLRCTMRRTATCPT